MKQITIGCDPEFVLKLNREYSRASNFVNDFNNKKRFGVDGSGGALEVRPKQNKDPLKVVYNIQKLLKEGYDKSSINVKFAGWEAGSYKGEISIGGHIHFSGLPFYVSEFFIETYEENKTNIEEEDFEDSLQINEYKKYAKLICALDTYLAQIIILLEKPSEAFNRHSNGGYGNLSNAREENWGFEYRTLGSWLTSPAVAAGVLCLAKVIAHEAVFNNIKIHDDIKPKASAFFNVNYLFHRRRFKRLWSRIKRMQLYPKYKKYINFLKCLILSRRIWMNQKKDMKISWGIIPATKPKPNIKQGDKVFVLHDGLWENRTVTSVIGKYFYAKDRLYTSQYWTKWRLK